jgi:hypothetical protein
VRRIPPRSAAGADPDREVIQAVVREAIPLVADCYDRHLAAHPGRAGMVRVSFAITGEPGVAGLVEDAAILPEDAKEGLGADPEFSECLRETLLSLEFPPPDGGGTVRVTYPFRFEPGAD